ncbi:transposase [Bacillus pumilus]|uniref:Transposase n=1 Tax=Bacillus pumilus TaxID=1408 RepID=A0A2A5IYX7_BACPU|nr:IS3 family transposase [Bacillus pumilus]PCK22544.1 transposase [Bacillus pumilus]
MGKNRYSSEIKWAVVKDKLSGQFTNQQIMEKYNIKNVSQIKTWMKWYRENQLYRFDQPIGKQYSFGHGPDNVSKEEKVNRQMEQLKMENEILKKVFGNRRGVEKGVALYLVERLRKKYTVTSVLSILQIARSTYYRWVSEGILPKSQVEDAIISLCTETLFGYGHRKIRELLQRQYGMKRNRNTVQRIMQKYHLQCRVKRKRKWKSQGESVIIAPNILNRDFIAIHPNSKWVTDITYIQYGPRTLYLSTMMDLYNNEVVAYTLDDHQQTALVLDTLRTSLEKRNHPKGVLIHSDQGAVYSSYAYQKELETKEIISSMSRRGNCFDNAVIEFFHSSLKSEEFMYTKFNSISEKDVRQRIDCYIKYYNEERIQEKLGYHAPKAFGRMTA